MQPDKIIHFLGGFGIAMTVAPFSPYMAFGAACVVGIGKELYDMTGRGTPDRYDLLATVVGGAVGTIAASTVKLLVV